MSVIYQYLDQELFYHHSLDERPNAENFPMHAHEMYEIYYYISGDGSYVVEGREYPLRAGSLCIVRCAEAHKLNIRPDEPYERIALHFLPRMLKTVDPGGLLTRAFEDRPLGQLNDYTAAEINHAYVRECLQSMCVAGGTREEQRLAVLIRLFPVLGEIQRAFLQKNSQLFTQAPASAATYIVDYINRHLADELSLTLLSNEFYISKSQLNRIFRQATGSSVWDYIVIKRLISARQRIRRGEPDMQACKRSGFREYSSFYRAYSKRFGVTPKEDLPQ